jgi:hypothetical protein
MYLVKYSDLFYLIFLRGEGGEAKTLNMIQQE